MVASSLGGPIDVVYFLNHFFRGAYPGISSTDGKMSDKDWLALQSLIIGFIYGFIFCLWIGPKIRRWLKNGKK